MTTWTVVHQAPPSMGFSRQEYWSGLPFPSPGISDKKKRISWEVLKFSNIILDYKILAKCGIFRESFLYQLERQMGRVQLRNLYK